MALPRSKFIQKEEASPLTNRFQMSNLFSYYRTIKIPPTFFNCLGADRAVKPVFQYIGEFF